MASQRWPPNGNVLVSVGPSCLSKVSRNSVRAQCSLVFAVWGLRPYKSAVSSTVMASTMRATKTARYESGSSSIAFSRTARISSQSISSIEACGLHRLCQPDTKRWRSMTSQSLRIHDLDPALLRGQPQRPRNNNHKQHYKNQNFH